jgi:hypothetical protein
VEVVRHEAIGDDPDAGEGLLVAEDFAEDFLLAGAEDPASINDTGNDMVETAPGSKQTRSPHEKTHTPTPIARNPIVCLMVNYLGPLFV